jgi:DNA-binding HxlR family transcriptional regulator
MLEFFGDKWSLLIVRELLFYRIRSFGDLLRMPEGISTGTLTTRISILLDRGILCRRESSEDKRAVEYRLTEKGMRLEPMLVEMVLWAADNEMPDLPEKAVEYVREQKTLPRSKAGNPSV